MQFVNFFLLLIAMIELLGDQIPAAHLFPDRSKVEAPWFTGPLLTSSPANIPKGHTNFEPYIFVIADQGSYDNKWNWVKGPTSWNNFLQSTLQIGVTNWLEVDVAPTLFYNYAQGASSWNWGDLPFLFAVKLLQTKNPLDTWNGAIRISFNATIPFGTYQKLDPKKLGTDIGGSGSWRPGVSLDWGNLIYIGRGHFISWRSSLTYTIPNAVRVQGLNAYGGDQTTLGTVYPAQRLLLSSGLELSLTQNWVVVMEAQATWGGKRHFKGKTRLPIKRGSFAQFTIAPAIEYNWNARLGVILGPWLTIAGRNSAVFRGGVIALNYYN